jgi:hypothetical protein
VLDNAPNSESLIDGGSAVPPLRQHALRPVANPFKAPAAPPPVPMMDSDNFRSRYEAVLEAVDMRALSLMRVILALSALLLIVVSPRETTLAALLTQILLFFYCAHSISLYAVAVRGKGWVHSRVLHWVDMGWYLVLVALTGVTHSALFSFFFFIILAASFRWGFVEGLRVTGGSAASYCAVGFALMSYDPQIELHALLLRAV